MVNKKATLKALRRELHLRHVTAIRTTEFAQVRPPVRALGLGGGRACCLTHASRMPPAGVCGPKP